MEIVVIGNSLRDFETSYSNILDKLLNEGHSISLLIVKDKDQNEKKFSMTSILHIISRISNIYLVKNFNYSKITQKNVNLLNPIIDKINPSLAIIPSINSSNKIRKILARSSLLACRRVENILMYDTTKSKYFLPTVYYNIRTRKDKSIQEKYTKKIPMHKSVEAFESHRMVLLQNDLF